MTQALEEQFHAAMLSIYEQAAELGYRPSYFLRMVHSMSGVDTARTLLDRDAPTDGFTRLWELGKLDLSIEAIALSPQYETLFTTGHLHRAEKRLIEYGYLKDDT